MQPHHCRLRCMVRGAYLLRGAWKQQKAGNRELLLPSITSCQACAWICRHTVSVLKQNHRINQSEFSKCAVRNLEKRTIVTLKQEMINCSKREEAPSEAFPRVSVWVPAEAHLWEVLLSLGILAAKQIQQAPVLRGDLISATGS